MFDSIVLAVAVFALGALFNVSRLIRDWKYADRRTRAYRRFTKSMIGIAIVAGLAFVGLQAKRDWKAQRKEAEETREGRLEAPGRRLTARLAVGGKSYRLTSPDGVFFKDGEETLLAVGLDGDQLVVSASFKDDQGRVIAKVIRNEWVVNPNLIFQRNYTRNGVEVIDEKDHVILQVIHMGNAINVEGTLHCSNGRTIQLATNPQTHQSAIILARKGLPPLVQFAPMCRYPAGAHLGECPGFAATLGVRKARPGPRKVLRAH